MAEVLKMENIIKCDARGPCRVCGEDGRACARCRLDFYCGAEHQRRDWGRHKRGCGAVQMDAGGWLAAARDVPAGTPLVRERPAIIFPRTDANQGWMLCRGCCCTMGPAPVAQCPSCGLPRCCPKCDQNGHHRAECAALQRGKFKLGAGGMGGLSTSAWFGLAMLRTYLWAREHPRLEEALTRHDLSQDDETAVALWSDARDWLQREAGVNWIAEDKLRRAFLLARQACVLHPSTWSRQEPDAEGVQAVYAGHGLVRQSCLPNVFSVALSDENMEHLLVAARDVRRGERLSLDHIDDPLQSAERRRESARRLSLLQCDCGQCADPSRGGTHLDSWTCRHCLGLVVPLADGLRGGRCDGCGKAVSRRKLDKAERAVRGELERLELEKNPKNGPAAWEAFLRRQLRPRGPLHPTSLLALRAKRHLATAVGAVLLRMGREHTLEELARWESMIRDVLDVLRVLRPGYNSHWTNVALPLCQLLCVRAMHVSKVDESPKSRALAKALLDEAVRLQDGLGLTLLCKEGVKGMKNLQFQVRMATMVMAGEI